jgi:ribosome-associated protein
MLGLVLGTRVLYLHTTKDVDGRDPAMTTMAIRITDDISIDEREIEESFVRSSGPGGQNVNKLSTAVQLRFDVRRSPALPNDVAIRLMRLAGKRMTKDGVLVLVAQSHRTQERNRADALERLVALIQEAAVRPVKRVATKPSRASKEKRLEGKKVRSGIKAMRRERPSHD